MVMQFYKLVFNNNHEHSKKNGRLKSMASSVK